MYSIISFTENVFKFIRIHFKILYWKLKYGKRIKFGKRVHFRKGLIINISKNGHLEIGEGTFFNNYCSINCRNKIIIGKNNLFGENVKIYDHNHVFNDKKLDIKRSYKVGRIKIGSRNWFGSNILILKNTIIGSNNVFAGNITINEKYGSDTIVKENNLYISEKIKYIANNDDKY